VLTNATAVLWTWENGANISLLYEVFIASVVFLLLPESALRWAASLFPRMEAAGTGERAREYVAHRLEGTANAFKELYESLRGAFQTSKTNDGNIASVFDRAAFRVCRSCALPQSGLV
jgi:stage II sporulation protein E